MSQPVHLQFCCCFCAFHFSCAILDCSCLKCRSFDRSICTTDSSPVVSHCLIVYFNKGCVGGSGWWCFISLPQLTPAPFRDREMTGDESVCTRPFFPVSFKCSQPAFVLGIKFPLSIVNAVSYTGPESNKFHTSHYISLVISFVKRGLNNKPGKPH